jgi:hypothetical protein
MANPSFHLHLDAALLPAPLMERMIQEGGFHFDDFPHQLIVEGKSYPARHLTKYLYAPISSHEVKAECLKLQSWVKDSSFKGLIQCEYVMEETQWHRKEEVKGALLPPLTITARSLSANRGDRFKKHELHLELDKEKSSERVITALRASGFHILENDSMISFTTCGHSRELLTIRRALKAFMKKHGKEITGKLTYEATAFWSLHGVKPETLPQIVDQVRVLQ